MENNKLVHYHQWANRPVERQVWNWEDLTSPHIDPPM
jgi:hypothetical protein